MATPRYTLPSSPAYTCTDRFSLHPDPFVTEDVNGQVPFWTILQTLLSTPITSVPSLIDLLETISVTLTGTSNPAGDHGILRRILSQPKHETFFSKCWPSLANLALQLSDLFPDGYIPILGRAPEFETRVRLSRKQTACLVIHQFLRTLRAPEWRNDGTHDFGIWYGSEQRQESAVLAYLEALFTYFEMVVCVPGCLDGNHEWRVEYVLRSVDGEDYRAVVDEVKPLGEIEVVIVDEYDTLPASLGVPVGAAAVSANKYVGFGQSATQEEVHVGVSPEACPAVLITPPLEDDQILVVSGPQAMVNVIGQRRCIRVEEMPLPDGGEGVWKERMMLFMDALELDLVAREAEGAPVLPDLLPGNAEREIRKAYTAFSSDGLCEVRTGLWGCGAFGGDPVVKVLLLWCAASLAGIKLVVVCDGPSRETGDQLLGLVAELERKVRDTAGLRALLEDAPRNLVRHRTAYWFDRRLVGS